MKSNNNLILGIGALLLLFFRSSTQSVVNTFTGQLSLRSVMLESFSFDLNFVFNAALRFRVRAIVGNDNSVPLPIERMTGQIKYNDDIVLSSFDEVFVAQRNLPAGSSLPVDLDFTVRLLDIGEGVFDAITGDDPLPDTRVEGFIYSNGRPIAYNKPILKIG